MAAFFIFALEMPEFAWQTFRSHLKKRDVISSDRTIMQQNAKLELNTF